MSWKVQEIEISKTTIAPILLIESNIEDASLMLDAFKHEGLMEHVHVIYDASEAMDYLFRRGRHARRPVGIPSLVITEVDFPTTSGITILNAIKSDERLRKIPVIIFSRTVEPLINGSARDAQWYFLKLSDTSTMKAVRSDLARLVKAYLEWR